MDRLFVSIKLTGLTQDAKLVSIGLVDESGEHKFYAELTDTWQAADAGVSVQQEVIPQLEGGTSRIAMVSLQKCLPDWIRALKIPVMLATDSLDLVWSWMETILKPNWPQNLAPDPLLLTIDYLCEFDAYKTALEAAFANGLRHHHALDAALAKRQAWYTSGGDISDEGGLPMLKARKRKDAEEVVSGKRDARSLRMIQKGDLDGFTFTENPESEYSRKGVGW